jgi:hypothetical protein
VLGNTDRNVEFILGFRNEGQICACFERVVGGMCW